MWSPHQPPGTMVLVLLPKIRSGSSGPRGAEETTLENLGWFCSNSVAVFCYSKGTAVAPPAEESSREWSPASPGCSEVSRGHLYPSAASGEFLATGQVKNSSLEMGITGISNSRESFAFRGAKT